MTERIRKLSSRPQLDLALGIFLREGLRVIDSDEIVIPTVASEPAEVDYECELAVVIGARPVRNVTTDEALEYVLGYTAANDVSARRWQGKKGGSQWSRSKSFDTFCPLGPALLLASPDVDPDNLAISTRKLTNASNPHRNSITEFVFLTPPSPHGLMARAVSNRLLELNTTTPRTA